MPTATDTQPFVTLQAGDLSAVVDLKDYIERPEQAVKAALKYIWAKPPSAQSKEVEENRLAPIVGLYRLIEGLQLALPDKSCRYWHATFGQGKSHLAMALAVLFGRPNTDAAVQELIQRIEDVDAGIGKRLKKFKEDNPKHLVITLHGTDPNNLVSHFTDRTQKALRGALGRDPQLGLWFNKGIEVLQNLIGEQIEKAQAALADYRTKTGSGPATIAELITNLQESKNEMRPAFDAAITAALGDTIGIAGAKAPGDFLQHVHNLYVGEGRPFSGILILFDEYRAFLEDYARDYAEAGAKRPLQSLLEGVRSLPKSVAFIGFGQTDLDLILRETTDKDASKLATELNRHSKAAQNELNSPLEQVLGGTLKKDESRWQEVLDQPLFESTMREAIGIAQTVFSKRYGNMDEIVLSNMLGYGCFPLHPLTVGLLCTSSLRQANDSRTLLSFLNYALERHNGLATDAQGAPNWVYATAIVNHFGEQLIKAERWQRFEKALLQAQLANKPILQAVMLIEESGLETNEQPGQTYAEVAAALCGISEADARIALHELSKALVLDYVANNGKYLLPDSGGSAEGKRRLAIETEALLQSKNEFPPIFERAVTELNSTRPYALEVQNPKGNTEHWKAYQIAVARTAWSTRSLTEQLHNYGPKNEYKRSYILCPIAANEEERIWFRDHAKAVFDETMAKFDNPPVVLLVLPGRSHDDLARAIARNEILARWQRDKDIRDLFGKDSLNKLTEEAEKQFEQALEVLDSNMEKVTILSVHLPMPYRGALEHNFSKKSEVNPREIMERAYEHAYPCQAPFAFTCGQTQITAATQSLLTGLIRNQVNEDDPQVNKGQYKAVLDNFLKTGKPHSWGLLKGGKIVEPAKREVTKAWELLDDFSPLAPDSHSQKLNKILLELMAPPYGYDRFGVLLLLGAWIGYHGRQVKISHELRNLIMNDAAKQKTFTEIVNNHSFTIKREQGQSDEEIERILSRATKDIDIAFGEAESLLVLLKEIRENTNIGQRYPEEAQAAFDNLVVQICKAEDHNTELKKQAESAQGLPGTLNGLEKLKLCFVIQNKPFHNGRVLPPEYNLSTVQERIRQRGAEMLSLYSKNLTLGNMEDYGSKRKEIDQVESIARELSLSGYSELVSDAKQKIENRLEELQNQADDQPIIEAVQSTKMAKDTVDIEAALNELAPFTPKGEVAKAQLEKRRTDLNILKQKHNTELEKFATQLKTVTGIKSTQKLASEIGEKRQIFLGSTLEDRFNALNEHAIRLSKLMEDVNEVSQKKPDQEKGGLATITAKLDDYAQTSDLAEAHVTYINEERNKLVNRYQKSITDAQEKLDAISASIDNAGSRSHELKDFMAKPGYQLLSKENKLMAESLKKELAKLVGQNKRAQITELFLSEEFSPADRKAIIKELSERV